MSQRTEASPLLPAEPPIDQPRHNASNGRPLESKHVAHEESHLDYGDIFRDVIIGFSDGLTVPFALTAGLSSLGSSRLVILGGLAELFSGSISMGLGSYLASITERDHYYSQEKRERHEVAHMPDAETEEIYEIMEKYNISRAATAPLVNELCQDQEQWVRFMMDFELKLERPNIHGAWICGLAMAASYFIGGLIPMIPYFFMKHVGDALFVSIGITVIILLIFGYLKNWVAIRNHRAGVWGALQTLVIGVAAAGTSYAIVKALG